MHVNLKKKKKKKRAEPRWSSLHRNLHPSRNSSGCTSLFVSATCVCQQLQRIILFNSVLSNIQLEKKNNNRRHYSLAGFTLRSISVSALCQRCERILAQEDFTWSSLHLHPYPFSNSLHLSPSLPFTASLLCLSFTPSPSLDFCPSEPIRMSVCPSLSPSVRFNHLSFFIYLLSLSLSATICLMFSYSQA